jgi:hypothetical protein
MIDELEEEAKLQGIDLKCELLQKLKEKLDPEKKLTYAELFKELRDSPRKK